MRQIRKLRALARILGMDCVQICLDLCHVLMAFMISLYSFDLCQKIVLETF
jgi:hypothetical protein